MAERGITTPSLAFRIGSEIGRWPAPMKAGSAILAVIILAGIFAPVLVSSDPLAQDLGNTLQPPSLAHPFGTDNFGRDVLTRVLYGIRIDLPFGFLTTYVPMI